MVFQRKIYPRSFRQWEGLSAHTRKKKLNSKASIFGIWFLRSGASEIIQNYEKVCPVLIQNHIIANKTRNIHV